MCHHKTCFRLIVDLRLRRHACMVQAQGLVLPCERFLIVDRVFCANYCTPWAGDILF